VSKTKQIIMALVFLVLFLALCAFVTANNASTPCSHDQIEDCTVLPDWHLEWDETGKCFCEPNWSPHAG
jgi:hypothetical protein